jgi:predicted DCC family thiol-disulfide oxidoreductase YuxK
VFHDPFDCNHVKVYYNSACPVCDAGIRYQRRRMEASGPGVEWIDIHRFPKALQEIGASQEFVRERLHVLDDQGRVRVGSEAFRALWSRTQGQHSLAAFFGLPMVNKLAQWAYNLFAAALYAWNRARRRW